MAFNSFDYVLFLCIVFFAFWRLVRYPLVRVLLLVVASYAFYTVWNGWFVVLILLSTFIDLACGYFIYRYRERPRLKKLLLVLSIIANLSILAYFKYTNFFIDNINALIAGLGGDPSLANLDIVWPVGISFYTFQSMSYTLDIYRGSIHPTRSPAGFFLFVSFFPQLVAGPIVRAREFLPQLDHPPRMDADAFGRAVYRIMRGLVKKMVLADYLAHAMIKPVFANPELFSSVEVFITLVAFHFHVYLDFSGYTDVALGSAGLFGFELPDNFNSPYRAATPAHFWRRWHMTLTRFVFDYLYIPMGGSRRGTFRTHLNVLLTFAVIGFWHGPNWNYVLFGVYHGVGVVLAQIMLQLAARWTGRGKKEIEAGIRGNVLLIVLTNVYVVFSLPLFRSPDLDVAWRIYDQVFSLQGWTLGFSLPALLVLLAAVVAHYIPDDWEERLVACWVRLRAVAQGAVVLLVGLAAHQMAALARQSFVYYQF